MKIFCIGRNYAAHAAELNNDLPTSPMIFMKPSTALLTEDKPFYHPEFSKNIHYELEIVLKICKNGKHIQPQFANQYYNEIGLGIDMTARDIQDQLKSKGHPWEMAKGFDNSAVLGSFVSLDSLPNEKEIKFQLLKNGNLVQDGNTKQLIFDFNTLIVAISEYFTLQVGDLIYTGTPAGVGKIAINDVFEGYLEGKKLLSCEIK